MTESNVMVFCIKLNRASKGEKDTKCDNKYE